MSLDNFKCEDCGGDKFTIYDEDYRTDFTIHCANKDCEASYTFRSEMKLSSSSHPPIRCSCGFGFLCRFDKYCNMCGKKNPRYKDLKPINGKKKGGKK